MKTIKNIGGCIRTLNFQGSGRTVKNYRIFYAVGRGRVTGIFDSWEACKIQICGVPGAKFKKFSSSEDAEKFVNFWRNASNSESAVFVELKDNNFPHNDENSSEGSTILNKSNLFNKQSFTAEKSNKLRFEASVNELDNCLKEIKSMKYTVTELVSCLKELKHSLKSNLNSLPRRKRSIKSKTTLCSDILRSKIMERGAINLGKVEKIEERKTNEKLTKNKSESIKYLCDDKVAFSNKAENEGINEISFTFDKDKDNYVKVYTDGSAKFNGKPNAKAGLGVWFGENHPLNVSQAVEEHPSSNLAEIKAAQMAVRLANNAGIKKLKIMTDSSYLLNSITKWIHKWRKNGWVSTSKKPIKHQKELENLYRDMYKLSVLWEKVTAHTGVLGNESAHNLAREGVPKDNGPPSSTNKAETK